MKKYSNGFILYPTPLYPQFPYKGRNWSANTMPSESVSSYTSINGKYVKERKLVVECKDYNTALKAFQLITSSFTILKGGNIFIDPEDYFKPYQEYPKQKNNETDYWEPLKDRKYTTGGDSIQLATLMAAKASYKNSYVYSIFRLFQSYKLISIPIIDLDPFHSENLPKHTQKSSNPFNVVLFATAITSAYSSVYELLNISYSEKFRETAEEELKRNNIDPQYKILWSYRGRKNSLEKELKKNKKIKESQKAFPELSKYGIRDAEITILDALDTASYLRSKVSAHKISSKEFHKINKTLSIYDVVNVQNLVRILLKKILVGKESEDYIKELKKIY